MTRESDSSSDRPVRVPMWLLGVAGAEAVWLLAVSVSLLIEMLDDHLSLGVLPEAVQVVPFALAAPVNVVGWLFVWGDDGPPYPGMETWGFAMASSILLYAVLGASAGALIGALAGLSRSR